MQVISVKVSNALRVSRVLTPLTTHNYPSQSLKHQHHIPLSLEPPPPLFPPPSLGDVEGTGQVHALSSGSPRRVLKQDVDRWAGTVVVLTEGANVLGSELLSLRLAMSQPLGDPA